MATISKSKLDSENWTMIIRPQRHWLDLRLGELWQARELVMLFVLWILPRSRSSWTR